MNYNLLASHSSHLLNECVSGAREQGSVFQIFHYQQMKYSRTTTAPVVTYLQMLIGNRWKGIQENHVKIVQLPRAFG